MGSGPYAIEIQATCQEGSSEKSEFILGLCKRPTGGISDLYFQPVFMPGMTLEQVRDQLITLRADGVHLRNENIPTKGMLSVWRDRYEIWHLRVLQTAKRLDPELRHKLWPLNTVQSRNLGTPVDGEHQQELNIISEILSRIENYLNFPSGGH